jgi:hypothetical protein
MISKNIQQWLCVAGIVAFLGVIPFREFVSYWLYYKPLYALFGDEFYLSIYLHWGGWLLFSILLFPTMRLVSRILDGDTIKVKKKKNVFLRNLLLEIGMVVLVFMFIRKDFFYDTKAIANNECVKTNCFLSTLTKKTGYRSCFYYINSDTRTLILNQYQYKELLMLLKKQSEIKVYFLPYSGRVLKSDDTI